MAVLETTHLIPSASDLLRQAGVDLGLTAEQVEQTLTSVNVLLKTPVISDRRIRVLNIAAMGVKNTGEAFTMRRRLNPGVWAIVHTANSAGKTSMLEFLVLPLRGAPRDLPRDVRSWIHKLQLDVVIAGRPIRIIIDASGGWERTVRANILSADSEQDLLDVDDSQLRVLAEAVGLGDVERVIGEFMLDALRMERTQVWQSGGGADGEGITQLHGWTAYFGACYLNPGGDEILLGDVSEASLPGRLLELFVDLPYSTALTELRVALKREQRTRVQRARRAAYDAEARDQQRQEWQIELDIVERKIAELTADSAVDVASLLRRVDETTALLSQNGDALSRAAQALRDAREARLRAEQAKMDAVETWQAHRVLGRLDPTCCPRCEGPITTERRALERESASCAVCTRPLPRLDREAAEPVLQQLDDDLTQAQQAEAEIAAQSEIVERQATQSRTEHEAARNALQQALTGDHPLARLRELEITAAELRGSLAATGTTPTRDTTEATTTADVLTAVHKHVQTTVDRAGKQLLPAMDAEIVALCERFGVQNLDSVRLTRSGQVNAVKAGQRMRFKDLSRGDRLRMRIATVIALLRVGGSRGVTSHPGLLLIDSIAAEELTHDAVRSLITELQTVASELPQLQVVFTTAQPGLVTDLLPTEHIITAEEDHLF